MNDRSDFKNGLPPIAPAAAANRPRPYAGIRPRYAQLSHRSPSEMNRAALPPRPTTHYPADTLKMVRTARPPEQHPGMTNS